MTVISAKRALRRALLRTEALARFRRKAADWMLEPWEHPTVFAVENVRNFPRFHRGFDDEAEAVADVRRVLGYTMTKYDRCITLHNIVKHLEGTGTAGAFVESGVWRGGSAGIMALANLRFSEHRRDLHLFDAWREFPDPTEADGRCYDALLAGTLQSIDMADTKAACEHLLLRVIGYPEEQLHLHEGLFSDTIPGAAEGIGPVALLRLDADWYESTRIVLDELAPSLVSGAVVVVDDYGYSDGARAAVDEHLGRFRRTPMLHFVDYACRYYEMP